MKKYFLLALVLLSCASVSFSQLSIFPSDEPVVTCGKKISLFKVSNPQLGATYHWSASPGAILSATIGDSIGVSFPSASLPAGDTGWVVVQQINSDGSEGPSAQKGIKILPPPQPYLTTTTRVGCERLYDPEDPREDPKDDEPLFIPEGRCIKACENSSVVYTVHGQAGSSFTWTVTGGTGYPSGNNITVNWGSVGQGTVTVVETNLNGCTGKYTICVDIIPKPHARFGVMPNIDERDIKVCRNQPVIFVDQSSPGTGSPLENWYWDFGDHTSYSSSTTSNPVHTYSEPGDYIVTLTVKNACNCTDIYEIRVHVMEEQGVTIVCPSLVCEGDRANYALDGKIDCKEYRWEVVGGTIISNNGPSIDVVWDRVDDDGFGYVIFDPSNCDIRCASITTVKIPVIKHEGKITGQQLVCTNSSYVYRLPAWPGTTFNWQITGTASGTIPVLHTDQPNEIVINTTVPETIEIYCEYHSDLIGCQGKAVLKIDVTEPAQINATTQACQGGEATFELYGSYWGSWQWAVKDPNNNTVYYDGPSNNPLTLTGLLPGTYNVSVATSGFCAPQPAVLTVQAGPAMPNTIAGPTQVCTGVVNEYSTGNASAGTTFTWSVTPAGSATFQGSNTGTSVGIIYNGSGPWQLSVMRTNLQSPNCSSAPLTLNISPVQVPLNISGSNVACPNTIVNYSVAYTAGETYEWTVVPQTAGSVKTGNNTPNVSVLWNNYSGVTPYLHLVVRKCNQLYQQDYNVSIVGLPNFSLSNDAEVCRGQQTTITLSSTTAVTTASLQWNFGDGTILNSSMTGTSASQIHTYAALNTSNVTYPISVQVTNLNGCTIDPFTVNSSIIVKPAPVVSITPGGLIRFCNTPINQQLTASLQSGFGSTASLIWHTPSGTYTCTNLNSPPCNPYTGTVEGRYYVEAVNTNGCSASSNWTDLKDTCPTLCEYNVLPSIQVSGTINCGHVALTGTYQSGGISPNWYITEPAVWNVNPANIVATASGGNASFSGDFTQVGNYDIVLVASYYDIHGQLCEVKKAFRTFIPLLPKMVYETNCNSVTLHDQSLYAPGTVFDHYVFYVYDNSNNLLYSQTVTPPGNSYTLTLPSNANYHVKMAVYYSHYDYNGGTVTSCETDLQTITLAPTPVASFTYDGPDRCMGVPVFFTNTSTPSTGLSYHWDFGDLATSLVENPARVYAIGTGRDVTLTVKNQNGCTSSATQHINIVSNNLSGLINAVPGTICEGSNALLQYSSLGGSPNIYKWMNNTTLMGITTPPVAQMSVSSSGYYWVRVEDVNQCYRNTAATNVSVIRLMIPVIDGPSVRCENQAFTLSTYAGDPAQVWYEWFESVNGGPFYSMAGGAEFDHPNGLTAGTYRYYVIAYTTNPIGGTCSRQSSTFILTVNPPPTPPTINYVMNDCNMYQLQLTASNSATGYYNWSNGMSGSTISVNRGGYYKVWFSAGSNGCTSEAEVNIAKDPKGYLWVLPEGCYERCPERGITINGPIIPFHYWEWNLNGNPYITGSNSVPQPLLILAPGSYGLLLNNGLCTASTINNLNLTVPRECATEVGCGFEWGEIQAIEQDACTWLISFDIHNGNPVPVAYTITVDVGGTLVPLSGVLLPGSNSINLQWNAPAGGGTATFTIRFWLPDGRICERDFWRVDFKCDRREEGRPAAPSLQFSRSVLAPAPTPALQLLPNPVNTITMVSYSFATGDPASAKYLEVYDLNGRKIASSQLQQKGSLAIDMSNRAAGVYLVVLKQNGILVKTAKMVVSR